MMIRIYTESDRQTLKEITVGCFSLSSSIDLNIEKHFGIANGKDWTWRKQRQIESDIDTNPAGIFVAEIDDAAVGYITTNIDHSAKIGSIPNLAVLPAHQQGGVGRALMDRALAYFREQGMELVRIETLETNAVGGQFYPSYGFVEVARQIHYAMPLDRQ
jgi:ribosomal protein S18 acetylase RimI-like enzyme